MLSAKRLKLALTKNNSKRAYQQVKDLTSEKLVYPQQSKTGLVNVLLKKRRFSADRQNIAQNCKNHDSCGDNAVLECNQSPEEDLQSILREEIEIAVTSLKNGNYRSR